MSHIRNEDVRFATLLAVLVGFLVLLCDVFRRWLRWGRPGRSRSGGRGAGAAVLVVFILAVILSIVAPLLARLIHLAASRQREYLADASGASFTRYPEGLASALEKIARAPQQLGGVTQATAPMYIINPLKRAGKAAANATSTHPPIDERVRILRSMGGADFRAYDQSYRQVTGKGRGVIPGSALKDEGGTAARAASGGAVGEAAGAAAGDSASRRTIARQVDDFFYRQGGYRQIECACGTVLKIPPDFKAPKVGCPRCGAVHTL